MATWNTFYVNTNDQAAVVRYLQNLAGISDSVSVAFPSDIQDYYLANEHAFPTYLVVGSTQSDWVTIVHNSFNKLPEWVLALSNDMGTKVIVTGAQSVSSYYYFAFYENGKMKRELEFCYSDDSDPLISGDPLWFEGEEPGTKTEEEDGEVEYFFDFDDIENYCKQFGLTIQVTYSDYSWIVLKKETTQKTIKDVIASLAVRKPWWKFW